MSERESFNREIDEDDSGIERLFDRNNNKVIQIAGAAIFGALSLIISGFTSPFIPRIPGWGIAFFDPTSLIWIICFLLFGVTSGIICCSIGSVGLIIFDPTGIGSVFKFFATIPHIIIPALILKLYIKGSEISNKEKLKMPRNYFFTGTISVIVRVFLMVLLNVLFFLTIFADFFAFANLEFIGFGGVTGWTAIIIGASIINGYQGVIDLVIPYLLVYTTGLDQKYDIW